MIRFLVVLTIIVTFVNPIISADSNSLLLSGPYFGQIPPGLTPQVFGYGIINSDLHSCQVFTPDGLEVFYSEMSGSYIMTSFQVDGQWTTPAQAPFTYGLSGSYAPCISSDGNNLYFVALNNKENIWKVERDNEGDWSTAYQLSQAINSLELHWQPSVADNGNIYFHSLATGGGDIYVSKFIEGEYQPAQPLPAEINSSSLYDHAPFIAPDESYIIFSRSEESLFAELYISFRNQDSSWTEAVSMDDLNQSGTNETAPNVTPDGKYLFYLHNTNEGLSAYWVSAEIINKYRSTQYTRIFDSEIVAESLNNSGCNWVDYNNDGYDDLFLLNNDGDNQLFANNGNGSFTEITGDIIVSEGGSKSSNWGDFDGNGYVEPYVSNGAPHESAINYLYLNDGDGSFSKVTDDISTTYLGFPGTSTCADYDNDGNLDIYVVDLGASPGASPWFDRLFKGDGTGHFTRIDTGVVAGGYPYMSSGVSWSDYDNDGDQDLLVLKIDSENMMFRNDGTNFTPISGVNFLQDNVSSSGASWGDYDNDGDLDLYITNYYFGNHNSLYENQGDGSFVTVTGQGIVSDTGWSTSSMWGDFNNDGYLDLYVVQNQWGVNSPDYFYMNNGNGSFTTVIDSAFVDYPGNNFAGSTVDFDNDGDLDLYLYNSTLDIPNVLYQNHNNNNGNWIVIKCIGTVSNRSAIGAKVRIKATFNSSSQWQLREINPQTGGKSNSSFNAHFGLGDANIVDSIKIEWPSGYIQILTDVEINQYLKITEACCHQERGNFDNDELEIIDVEDLVFMIDYQFRNGEEPHCFEEADLNIDGIVDVSDLIYMIDYQFRGGAEPPPC